MRTRNVVAERIDEEGIGLATLLSHFFKFLVVRFAPLLIPIQVISGLRYLIVYCLKIFGVLL